MKGKELHGYLKGLAFIRVWQMERLADELFINALNSGERTTGQKVLKDLRQVIEKEIERIEK